MPLLWVVQVEDEEDISCQSKLKNWVGEKARVAFWRIPLGSFFWAVYVLVEILGDN